MGLKYGCITPNAKGRSYPVAASQYFNHNSGGWVYLDGSGHITNALTATATIFGWVDAPVGTGAGAAGSAYWKSSATAGADSLFVVTDKNAQFIMPADDTVTVAMAGNACDLVSVNDGTVQTADVGTSTTDVLIIQCKASTIAAGMAVTDVVVMLNEAKRQTDT